MLSVGRVFRTFNQSKLPYNYGEVLEYTLSDLSLKV